MRGGSHVTTNANTSITEAQIASSRKMSNDQDASCKGKKKDTTQCNATQTQHRDKEKRPQLFFPYGCRIKQPCNNNDNKKLTEERLATQDCRALQKQVESSSRQGQEYGKK